MPDPAPVPARRLPAVARLAPLLAALCVLAPGAAEAGTRHAIVIGSNFGDPEEARLSYAESDAVRFGATLTRLGGVAPEDLILLTNGDAGAVKAAIASLTARIAGAPGEGSVLFIYYSGHADSKSLHLRGTRLSFESLRQWGREAGAEVTVFVVDACRSGGITRVKGAHPAVPFEITPESRLDSEGIAIITSAAATEDAQESERLKGGIFTHHFLNGLAGAADATGDQVVTLTEAYRYAYAQTLNATADTPTLQHPTFEFTMRGRQEIELTRLDNARGFARVLFDAPGHYLVFAQTATGDVAAELDAVAGTSLLLSPGRYVVRRRTADQVAEGAIVLTAGTTKTLAGRELTAIPFRETVRRGYSGPTTLFSLGGGFEASGPLLPSLGPAFGGYIVGQWDFRPVALQTRIRFAQGVHDNGAVVITDRLLGADLGVVHAFDLARGFAFGLGLRVGADWFRETFDTSGQASTRDQFVVRLAPLVRFEWAPVGNVILQLDAGAEIYALRTEDASGAAGNGLNARVVPFGTFGFGVRWP